MRTTKRITCAPTPTQIETLSSFLKQNGFVVVEKLANETTSETRRRAVETLKTERDKRNVRCATWFEVSEEATEMFVEVSPTTEDIMNETVFYRRRHPKDMFEGFAVVTNIQAPMYGLASALAEQVGIKAEWKRDSERPMVLTISKVVPLAEEELAEAKKPKKKDKV